MKWYSYLICFAIIVVAGFALLDTVEKFTAVSVEIGTVDADARYYTDTFSVTYGVIPFVANETGDKYTYSEKLPSADWDGQKEYIAKFNGRIVPMNYQSGIAKIQIKMNFYAPNGNLTDDIIMAMELVFYDSYTLVKIDCNTSSSNMANLTQYIYTYGFELAIREVK